MEGHYRPAPGDSGRLAGGAPQPLGIWGDDAATRTTKRGDNRKQRAVRADESQELVIWGD